MKFVIVLVALFAVAMARPGDVQTEYYDSDVKPDGFKFKVATSDGTSRQEEGVLKDADTDHESLHVSGSYTWKDEKTGQVFTTTFTADENGYQAVGDHLPKAE